MKVLKVPELEQKVSEILNRLHLFDVDLLQICVFEI